VKYLTVRRVLDRFLNGFAMLLLGTLSCVTFMQVLNRYIIQFPLTWTEEIARFIAIWASLIGAVLCVREGTHIEIDYFYAKFGPKVQRIIDIIINIIFILFLFFLIWQGTDILKIIQLQSAPASGISMVMVYIAGPISSLFMLFYLGEHLYELISGSKLVTTNNVGDDVGKEDI
jgi:TRAP-type C4-dicarboxylate transport system permease small subunit